MTKKPLLFCVYGASGSGKSELIRLAKTKFRKVSINRKQTTRKRRRAESQKGAFDLEFVEKINPENSALTYSIFGNKYAVNKRQIEEAEADGGIHFVIIAEVSALKKFRNRYPNAILLYVHCDPDHIPKRIQKRDSLNSYKKRKKRIEMQYKHYINESLMFDHVIFNLWEREDSLRQLQSVIKHYRKKK